jgi:2-oxoglutarate dehydrogenase E2 component (dihydrolipoamide succinyltransferase)
MAQVEMIMPRMGESIAEATILKWIKNIGDPIDADESVLEIATDKVDSDVPSPVAGILIKRFFEEGQVVQVGAVIALISSNENKSEKKPVVEEKTFMKAEPSGSVHEPSPVGNQESINKIVPAAYPKGEKFYSPLIKNIASQEGIPFSELENIPGSGIEGRLTKNDLLNYLAKNSERPQVSKTNSEINPMLPGNLNRKEPDMKLPSNLSTNKGNVEIIEMDRMRKLISEHMLMSKQVSAHVTSFVEVDVTNIVKWREKVKDEFEKREKEKITFTPIFIEAVVKAIKDFPLVNVSIEGTSIILKKYIHIGMATALPSGNLIVPVIKDADQKSLIGLTKAVNDLATRARNNSLSPDEIKDGTFTITNVGTFGNVAGTPIINQPQVAILAIGVIKKKPAVIETEFGDTIGIRHMMFLSLSYDHRIVDGALGGRFLRRIADNLESFSTNTTI